ncbi:alpha-L-fucosidase [Paractinoplanes rishiriensis]|uniref:alpha-L-fucosidase n=1 Tax=Paractinoplanes rishiriensis TaxID=1050105 RepID=A0A919K8V0_9ACTN|nr:alpha-L-fucosidase [Actinoplanes rishiriensis]GIF00858.1 alpha-L-fucosidase [Actinoplanes rishiriensis]
MIVGVPGGARAAIFTDPVPVPLDDLFDNNGIGVAAGDANLDGSGHGFPAAGMPTGSVTVDGVPYRIAATSAAGQNDNVVALGQSVAVPAGQYVAGFLLAASAYGSAGGTVTVHYADGTTSSAEVSAPDWFSGDAGAVTAPYRYGPGGTDQHAVALYAVQVWMDPARTAQSITLPSTAAPAEGVSSLHVFAFSLQPAVAVAGAAVRLLRAAGTTRQMPLGGGRRAQVVDVTVLNVGTEWVSEQSPLTVTVSAEGVNTIVPATVRVLAPGGQARVEVGIDSPSLPAGTAVDAEVRVTGGAVRSTMGFSLTAGIPAFVATDASLGRHQAPDWFTRAKFGIFIHWGVYSVPAWAPVGKEYAEWYWQHMDDPNGATYAYHEQTYGRDFAYDDFIPKFTAAKFDPVAWARLFQQAGARYFVLTSKHHDGFCLFDSAYTDRTSVKLGPHRDLVRELFDAARSVAPELHRGLYYSLPEWYNPALPWMGHAPQNPYTGAPLPYIGYREVADYQRDLQVPQLEEIVTKYRPEVLWGDIGYPATDRSVLQLYFNQGLTTGDQVTVNNRMGLPDYDFTTPEYASTFSLQTSIFEANRGIDPFSFGYNAATPDSAYATTDDLIAHLVDIVSKNGNLLLDIGPRADGTIPDIMRQRLLEIGAWLTVNGEGIHDTTYWANGAADGNLRFTIRPDEAFYLHSLTPPSSTISTIMPVPIRDSDQITMLGYQGGPLHWTRNPTGGITIEVPAAAREAGSHAWTFKVSGRR